MKFKAAHILGMILIAVLSTQCKGKGKEETKMKETNNAQQATGKWQPPTAPNVDISKKYFAVIKTTKGNIKIELYPKEAPLSVTNFTNLAQKHFYKGLT
ncbi:MAG: peptidylprolyl isomerase, partial [bacterium]|nr:peptidylprolyl isomerase [bacterium]